MHTHKDPGTFRIRDTTSGPNFVAGLKILPKSHDQVDDMGVILLLRIKI